MTSYRHTQIGWANVALFLIAAAILPTLNIPPGATVIVLAAALAALVLFSSLTVVVTEHDVTARLGIGLIRRSIALDQIESVETVRNEWWYGWGVRVIPGGMMYTVYGLSAVELRLANGSRFRIGTDEPDALARAVLAAGGDRLAQTSVIAASQGPARRRRGWVPFVALSAVLALPIAVLALWQLRPPVVNVGGAQFSVRSGLYSVTVPVASVTDVSLEQALPPVVSRTNGFELGDTLRGRFRLDRIGDARLFVNRSVPPYVRIDTTDLVVFVNFTDANRTQALYQELARLVAGR